MYQYKKRQKLVSTLTMWRSTAERSVPSQLIPHHVTYCTVNQLMFVHQ